MIRLALLALLLAASGSPLLGGCEGGGVLPDDDDASLAGDDHAGDDDAGDDDTGDDDDAPVAINEVQANNDGAFRDARGEAPDWIEVANRTDEDLDLRGWFVSDDWTDPQQHVLPEGVVIPARGHRVLWASGDAGVGPTHLPFRLDDAGEAVGLFDPAGAPVAWTEVPALRPGEVFARLPDSDGPFEVLARGTPGAPNVRLVPREVEIVPAGSTWRYDDGPTEPAAGAWQDPEFDDGAWAQGPAPLGYGDPVATTLDFGPDPADKRRSARFRLRFVVPPDVAGAETTLALRADDGAVVYLGGVEVARVRLPAGPLAADTLATATVGGDGETAFAPIALPAGALVPGANVLAVAVHQADPASSDLTFDLALVAVLWDPAP